MTTTFTIEIAVQVTISRQWCVTCHCREICSGRTENDGEVEGTCRRNSSILTLTRKTAGEKGDLPSRYMVLNSMHRGVFLARQPQTGYNWELVKYTDWIQVPLDKCQPNDVCDVLFH